MNKNLKYFELDENENTTQKNLWDAAIGLLMRKAIMLNACEERPKTNNLSFLLNTLEKEEIQSKLSKRKKKKKKRNQGNSKQEIIRENQ
jgi:hypothetical protein